MTAYTLVRHGQAQSHATDSHSYDSLSDLGHQQARWLGGHLVQSQMRYGQIITGTLTRQKQTAQHLADALGLAVNSDARLNEFDYFGLATALRKTHALAPPTSREDAPAHMSKLFNHWQSGDVDTPHETFPQFQTRVSAALADANSHAAPPLLVTSGGVIATAIHILPHKEHNNFSETLLNIHNTSLHHFAKSAGTPPLKFFNDTPHLDASPRQSARTYI